VNPVCRNVLCHDVLFCHHLQSACICNDITSLIITAPSCDCVNQTVNHSCADADVPTDERFEMLKAVVLLLPDVHRETLHCLLLFLSDMAKQSEHNQASLNCNSAFAWEIFCLFQDFGYCFGHRRNLRGRTGTPTFWTGVSYANRFRPGLWDPAREFTFRLSSQGRHLLSPLLNWYPHFLDQSYAPGLSFLNVSTIQWCCT